ncbi:MAG TPA: LacI family DNA-binding transcriptional regulator [Clostridia bacterium]
MATIRDVARLAKVSIATVSRILNNSADFNTTNSTREAVLEAARQLNYSPSQNYKRKNAPSKKVGVIINMTSERFYDSYFMKVLEGIKNVLAKNDYELNFIHSQHDFNETTINELFETDLKGLILMVTPKDFDLELIRKKVKHLVGVDTSIYDIDNVRYNRYEAGYKAMTYLIENNHRDIAYIGSIINENDISTLGRYAAYKNVLAYYNIPYNPEWVINSNWERQKCFSLTQQMLSKPKRPSAIFVASDHMAIASMSAIYQMGLRIPDDISVISISNIESSKYTNPPLTTISIPQIEMGNIIANTLIKRIEGDKSLPQQIYVPTELIVRNSVKTL